VCQDFNLLLLLHQEAGDCLTIVLISGGSGEQGQRLLLAQSHIAYKPKPGFYLYFIVISY